MSVLKVKKDSVWEEVGGISGHTHTTTDITNFPSSLPADGGNADTVDGKHASDFAAATDMTTAQSDISDLQSKVGDATVSAQISAAIEEIVTTAESKVSTHNTGTDTHSDIRLLISGLTDRLNALADSDDTTLDQLSEVVAYIKSNRELIEAITTSKVSVADIVDNLTTNIANKPLSAAQGVALKALIDAITVPDKLPNPNALTFTGAVTGSYDGSAPLSVEIPQGGGGSSGGYVDTIIADIKITEEVSTYQTSTLTSDQVEALKNADIIYFCANLEKPSDQTTRGNLLASIFGNYYNSTKFFYNDAAYKNVTPSSSAYGGDIAESISVKNEASGQYFQQIKWKSTDNQYGDESEKTARTTIVIPGMSVFRLSTSTVFGVGTTAKLIARRFL